MTLFQCILKKAVAHKQREDGSATIEFVIMFPLVMSILLMGIEAGMTSVQRIALERAVDLSVRSVRLGKVSDTFSHDEFRDDVCDRSAVLRNCTERLLIEMRRIDTASWNFPQESNDCVDLAASIQPVTAFTAGASENVMYLRACYLVEPIFPTTPLGLRLPLDSSGMYALRTTTGFVNE
jgi:hypothetical protein